MDTYNEERPPQDPQPQPQSYQMPPNGFSTASLVLGIIALCTSCCIYLSIPCAALGILFALLSKGGNLQMNGRSKTGLGLSIGALVATIVAFVFLIVANYSYIQSGEFEKMMQDYMQYYYGDTYNRTEEQLPQDLQDMLNGLEGGTISGNRNDAV